MRVIRKRGIEPDHGSGNDAFIMGAAFARIDLERKTEQRLKGKVVTLSSHRKKP